ncbi:L-ascorbate metabolism protein UlaG (beta-lactamase superfamily) [Stackebrandtia albiflava]|uniref:L-ascorbate metabolism protein UlaG (Beta-lactamase superfamily) n=1 Tax=Stackebrandtia albiflava TaxID=406432 RepID=A0A562V2D6_9ACTN|nr:MBL fold metallo-hydrolase [Stackebrandtia albiflava]TWJ12031.1 L-ascorbate metabolism protein UlaG (beta-lactamase superfamily) [Stackebrandtia albiflava]
MARTWRGLAIGAAVAAGAAAAGWLLHDIPSQVGHRPLSRGGPRAARIRRSRQFDRDSFVNPMPASEAVATPPVSILKELTGHRHQRRPQGVVPLVTPVGLESPGEGLRAAWFGHSTVLIDIEGRRILLDPVWSRRVSPSRLVGPRRLHEAPIGLAALPPVDAVVISHDHYDHLDRDTVLALVEAGETRFIVPLGVGAHLDRWGVPADRYTELDWNESVDVDGVTVTATAARHFSGRWFTRNDTLWASWVIAGRDHRVFYGGDTGYFKEFRDIGTRYGPFDLTVLPVGAYHESWPDIHMTPEEAVAAHLDLSGRVLLPVHWATFTLAMHPWGEPVDRLWREAKERDVTAVVPRPGEVVDVAQPPPVDGWWQTINPT